MEQLRELHDPGWLIASRTADHTYLGSASEADAREAVLRSQHALRTHGFMRGSKFFAYPGGQSPAHAGVRELLARQFIARKGMSTPILIYDSVGVPSLAGRRGWNFGAETTLQAAKDYVDKAVSDKYAATLMFHYITEGAPTQSTEWSVSDSEAICEYVAALRDAGQLEVLTAWDAFVQHSGEELRVKGTDYISSRDVATDILIRLPG